MIFCQKDPSGAKRQQKHTSPRMVELPLRDLKLCFFVNFAAPDSSGKILVSKGETIGQKKDGTLCVDPKTACFFGA